MTDHVPASNNTRTNDPISLYGASRERPWLLASNRKLRHLEGISVRNLTLTRQAPGQSGKANDDDSLPHALKTPTKTLALRESHKLEHSRSSSDLKSPPAPNGSIHKREQGAVPGGSPEKAFRPQMKKLRRRSTLNWANAPPETRQKQLEDVVAERLADTFFSLHCANIEEPIYVSEVKERAINPSFRFFDLNTYGPWITRRDELTIKYWAQTRSSAGYFSLVELEVHLRSLQFIGKTLEGFHHPLPQNCILFHLSDGIYTSFTDLPLAEPPLSPSKPVRTTPQTPQPTSSFDALMRLSNIDNCIQDALSVREKLCSQITTLIEEQRPNTSLLNSADTATSSLEATNRALSIARQSLLAAQKRRSDIQSSLTARRAAIATGTLAQQKAASHLSSAQYSLSSRFPDLQNVKTATRAQIRRIASNLLHIYPLEPIPHKPLHFTLASLPLPPASLLPSSPTDETAAALGHAAHLTHLLSHYLATPLPYPLTPHGSTSTVYDPISMSMHSAQARTFPLFGRVVAQYRFEYGVFLLGTDIERLLEGQGVRLVDLRQVSGNLRLLMSVLVGGEGEVPARSMEGGMGRESKVGPEDGEMVEGRAKNETEEQGEGRDD